MSVTVRPYRNGGWEADIRIVLPNGDAYRERRRVSVSSKTAAKRAAQARETHLLLNGPPQQRKEIPTLVDFRDRLLEQCRANREKPSSVHAKASHLDQHLIPLFGDRTLDNFSPKDVEAVKARLKDRSPKTVNNVFTTWRAVFRVAVALEFIDRWPIAIRDVKTVERPMEFYDFDEFERYVDAARTSDTASLVIALLGGEAGLRAGEMIALDWADIDHRQRQLRIDESAWRGNVTAPKSGKVRFVPLTRRLSEALAAHRHLRSARVLSQSDGTPWTWKMLFGAACRTSRRAGLNKHGVHILRHTFGSHLAMRGAPARAIQELMGHADIQTTQRYMHLSPSSVSAAIRLLETPGARGDIVETERHALAKS